jgi:hypothetical protein
MSSGEIIITVLMVVFSVIGFLSIDNSVQDWIIKQLHGRKLPSYEEAHNECVKLEMEDWSYRFEAWCREAGVHYDGNNCGCKECKRRVGHEAYMISQGYERWSEALWVNKNSPYNPVAHTLSYSQFSLQEDNKCGTRISDAKPEEGDYLADPMFLDKTYSSWPR